VFFRIIIGKKKGGIVMESSVIKVLDDCDCLFITDGMV